MGCLPIEGTEPIDAICIPKEITDLTDLTQLSSGKYIYRIEALDKEGRIIETSMTEIETTEDLEAVDLQSEATIGNEIGLIDSSDDSEEVINTNEITENLHVLHLQVKSTESNKIRLNWAFLKDIPDIQTYRIYRNDDLIASVARGVTTFKDTTKLAPGKYVYRLETFDNEERKINEYKTEIVVKKSIEAEITASNKVKLNWAFLEDISDIQKYKIYRNGVPLKWIPKETTQYIDTAQLIPGKYIYKVITFDHEGNIMEKYSARIRLAKSPDLLRVLQVHSITPNKIELSWKSLENPDIQEYKIYRNIHLVGVVSPEMTKFTDKVKLIPGKYIYRLEALDEEIAKLEVEALPLQTKFSASNEIKLNWAFLENVPGIQIQTYKIYRNEDLVASLGAEITEFIDQKLAPGEYIYRLDILNNEEEIIHTYFSNVKLKSKKFRT